MKTAVFLLCAGLLARAISAAPIPAFPGAEGYAAHAVGGRGGDVYIVENLNANGPGSFAQGIAKIPPQGRTIVFAVSGYIPINKLHLKAGKVTIAGQTSPGGIGLRGSSFRISSEDTVIRYMRFRHGRAGNGGDCVNPDGGCTNLVFDHCDMLFARDENFSMFRSAPVNMTYQWTVNAWGLQPHSCGGLWLVNRTTTHHALFANNHTRNPKVIRPTILDWANNVTFGWDIGMNMAGAELAGPYRMNLRGSSFLYGSGRKRGSAIFGGGTTTNGIVPFTIHVADCALDGNGDSLFDVSRADYDIVDSKAYNRMPRPFPQTADPARPSSPAIGVPVTLDDRVTAYKKIVSQVGPLDLDIAADRPLRDDVSALLIADLIMQKRRMIADEKELGVPGEGLGMLKARPAPSDRDRDGMPDIWEKTMGADQEKPDHNVPCPSKNGLIAGASFFPPGTPAGYTRLEEYLHFLAIPHGIVPQGKPIRIDLRKFTAGFAREPQFRIDRANGGTIKVSGPGNCLITFIPGKTGRASFTFTVTDADRSSWTQTCALLATE